jgi:serine/threonine-protein kinase HipA
VTLPTWFSHLLPEGRLRDAVASAAQVNPKREFFLLARTGLDDLPGAMRIRPSAVADGDHERAAEEFDVPTGHDAEKSRCSSSAWLVFSSNSPSGSKDDG